MSYYGLFGKFPTPPGQADALEAILLRAADLMRQARGCRIYQVCRDTADPDSVGVYEVWDSPEDHAASLQYPGVNELIDEARPLIGGPPDRFVLEVKGGVGFPGPDE